MDKKIISIFVSMLLFATVISVAGTGIYDKNAKQSSSPYEPNESLAMWDLQFNYPVGTDTGSVYLVGIVYDGTYFYCPEFNSNKLYRFDHDGNYIDYVTMPGVPNLIDLAYDGTYVYGTSTTGNILYEMNMTSLTVVSQITLPSANYNVAYDANADGGNGGFWIGQWQDHLTLISRSGTILDSITPVPDSMLGMAWDPWTKIEGYNGPFLWISTGTSTGMPCIIKVIDLATKTIVPGVEHNVANELGSGMAGGLEFMINWQQGTGTLYGTVQGDTNDYAFGYEVCITNQPPVTPAAPNGPTNGITKNEYTFTAVTTDPEEEQISYIFDWGDGNFSDWIGPFNSGQQASATHIWTTKGNYDIKVKAKDANGGETDWSPAHTITIIQGPILKIGSISGGLFYVKATILNYGEAAAENVEWTIELVGGAFINKKSTGTVTSINIGEGAEIQSKLIVGLGATVIKVSAKTTGSTASDQKDGFIFIIFIT